MADYDNYHTSYPSFLTNNQPQDQRSPSLSRTSANDSYEGCPPTKVALIGKYPVVQDNGHRRFGPPSEWVGEPPLRGCEVFIGKIPKDCLEDELIPVFETVGPIYEFRLMVDFNGINRGYGFCVYQHKEHSNKAVEKLNNYEIRPGKAIGVCFSVDNCRLFVGGIPKNKTKEEILGEMQRVSNGVVDVIAYPSIANKNKNRGFAFVEYESHKAAAVARRKLIPGRIPLWGQQIAVDWAEPEREVQETVMSTVKILYARNLMLSTTEETLRERFLDASEGPCNCIERVKKMKDYAFIHFTERIYAEKAKNALNNTDIDGCIIEVAWAKPADKSPFKQTKNQQSNNEFPLMDLNGSTQIYFDPNTGLSYLIPTMAGWPNTFNMLNEGSNRSKGARRNAAGSRNAGMIKDKRQFLEYLEELASTYNWGTPQYSTSVAEVDRSGSKAPLYSAQVYLPNLNVKQLTQVLHSTPEDAKSSAAELFIKSVTQPPSSFSGLDMRQQLVALQTLSQMQLASLFNPHSGAINQTQPSSLDLSTAAAASLYYLQPGLANSGLFHPSSLLPSMATSMNIPSFNNLYQTQSTNLPSLVKSPSREGNSFGNLFTVSNGLNLLQSPNSLSLLSNMNMETGNAEGVENSSIRRVMLANQQQSYLFNSRQTSVDPTTVLMTQQIPGQ